MSIRLDISMMIPGMAFHANSLREHSLGGSETAGLSMALALGGLGHRVTVFCNTPKPGERTGSVTFRPLGEWESYARMFPHDVAIVQRLPGAFGQRLASKLNILWCHDLALKRAEAQFKSPMWNIDHAFVVSDWMREQYEKTFNIKPGFVWTTRNGIDTSLIPEPTGERDPNRVFYSARPERGLDVLLREVFPRVLKANPKATLAFATYMNGAEELRDFYAECHNLAGMYPHGAVTNLGHLTKPQLYAEMQRSGVYAYPTPSPVMNTFCEVSCITMMEAMACGLPIVATDKGALAETTRGIATMIDGDYRTEGYFDCFAEGILSVQNSLAQRAMSSVTGRELIDSGRYDWTNIAREWVEKFEQRFAEVNDSPKRLARHFYKRSDIDALTQMAVRGGTGDPDIDAEVERKYAFVQSDEACAKHYAEMSRDTDRWLGEQWQKGQFTKERFRHTQEQRFHRIADAIKAALAGQTFDKHPRVFDYGCGHGWMGMWAASQLPLHWVGYDMDEGARAWSARFAETFQDTDQPGRFGVISDLAMIEDGSCDAIVCSEVLEHVLDLNETLAMLERKAKPGAPIIITVPYGPQEYATYNWVKYRNHIRELEPHDLRDILGAKPDFALHFGYEKYHERLGEAMGFMLAMWRADGKDFGTINFDRKIIYQRPAETLSVNLIAGPNVERMMDWVLERFSDIADEIIIADTGLSDQGRFVALSHGAIIVPSRSPLVEGFDTCRNDALNASSGDWVLWIDTDELLMDEVNINKYLRRNILDGYAVKQHHFACDGQIPTDIPVRLFRRAQADGKEPMKFVGTVHEHPERGMNNGPGEVVVLSDMNIAHAGYLVESIRKKRFERNLPLLDADTRRYPGRKLTHHLVMRDHCHLIQYEAQQNGGKVTPMMRARAAEVRRIYLEHFNGKDTYFGLNPDEYYSTANRVLNEGFEADVQIRIAKDGVGDPMVNGSKRYATMDDLMKDVDKVLRDKTGRFDTEFW